MEHSQPLPDGQFSALGQLSLPSYALPAVISPTNNTLAPRTREVLNQQSRRLQLRNVGFRGPILPARRISPIFGTSYHASDSSSRPMNNENSPTAPENQRLLYGEDVPPSPVNILQQIHNSTRRKRVSPKPGFGAIFQDSTTSDPVIDDSGTSWYNETDNHRSPTPLTSNDMMKLREGSLNGKTPPPLSSPLAKQVKGRNLNRLNLRSTSFEASKYIEHLESQLTAVNSKLDSLMSPTTNKARAAKLRALTVETRSLRQEVCDWENNFSERVKEAADQRTVVEVELRSQLLEIEAELEKKDGTLRELEWECESMRAKVADAEGLGAVNLNLERRIDVLSNLLVQSPTKLDLCSATSSPTKADPLKRTPRPRSMLPMLPSSPGGVRLSLPTVSETAFWHSESFGSTSSISESPSETGQWNNNEEQVVSPDSMGDSKQTGNLDLDSGASASLRSAPHSSSRPTSIQSGSSLGTASWGLPLPSNPESRATSISRQRRMRRFPSGSCSLKPLILPTAAITASFPASAPAYSLSPTAKRDFTDISLDPTTAFLSRRDFSSPISTSAQPRRQRSTSWVQEQTLRSLEGKPQQSSGIDTDNEDLASQTSSLGEQHGRCQDLPSHTKISRRTRPRSIMEELQQANVHAYESFEDGLIPVSVEDGAKIETIPIAIDPVQIHTPLHDGYLQQRRPPIGSDTTPRPGRVQVSVASPKACPSPATTGLTNAFGMFSRLTNLIARTKQDPFILAQRLLCNAWILGSTRLGGTGWWLLGLVFGSHCRQRRSVADQKIVEEKRASNFDWDHYSARASRLRTAEHYLHDRGSTRTVWNRNKSPKPRDVPVAIPPKFDTEPRTFPCDDCTEPSSRRTFRLWFQFSLAIVLAVGVAIKHGPGSLLVNDDVPPLPEPQHYQHQRPSERKSNESEAYTGEECMGEDEGGDGRSAGFTFAESLDLADFEDLG